MRGLFQLVLYFSITSSVTAILASEDVVISFTPNSMVLGGQSITLSCNHVRMNDFRSKNHCAIWWQRKYIGNDQVSQILHSNKDLKISTLYDGDSVPTKSDLLIHHFETKDKGRYICTLTCDSYEMNSEVFLEIGEVPKTFSAFEDPQSVMIGGAVAIGIIGTILLATIGYACVETCKRKILLRSNAQTDSTESLFDGDAVSEDLPPRYSIVAATSNVYPPVQHLPNNCATPRRERLHSNTSNKEGIFVIAIPPPEYSQALKDLEAKGFVFDPESLKPMPPAYTELEQTSPNK